MRRSSKALLLSIAAIAIGCVRPERMKSGKIGPPSAPKLQIWVDRSASPDGDGSARSPLKDLAAAITKAGDGPAEIHLRSGLYEAALKLRPGVAIVGHGAVVIHAEGDVVIDATGGELEGIFVQGGQSGLRANGEVMLRRVSFSGQRAQAIDLQHGTLRAEQLTLEASVSETIGVRVSESSTATVSGLVTRGPFRRAIEVNGGTLELVSGDFQDAVTAVHVNKGSASIQRVQARGGRGPALYVGAASLRVHDAAVFGHEYGLLAGQNAQVEASELLSIRAERAGVALSQANATLSEITAVDSGNYGGLQLVNSTVRVDNFRVHGAQSSGVVVRGGNVKLEDGVVTRTTASDDSSGDGIEIRFGEAQVTSVLIAESEGAGVVAGNAAKVALQDVIVDRAKQGGVVSDYLAAVRANSLVIRNAKQAALVAIEGGKITADLVTVEGSTDSVAWAECAAESGIRVTRLSSQLAVTPMACVRVER